jgi:hypothetical protein
VADFPATATPPPPQKTQTVATSATPNLPNLFKRPLTLARSAQFPTGAIMPSPAHASAAVLAWRFVVDELFAFAHELVFGGLTLLNLGLAGVDT